MKKIFFILLLLCFGAASAQTNVSGGIYTNTTWTAANSPYIVTDTVVVFPGLTLTLEPGVTVKFDTLTLIEMRESNMIALGTVSDSITFTSNLLTPSPESWVGLYLKNGTLASQFNYCNVFYSYYGINNFSDNTLMVRNSTLKFNYKGISTYELATIDSCTISNNGIGFSGNGPVNHCTFSNNVTGIFHDGANASVQNSKIEFNQNGILQTAGTISNCTVRYNGLGIRCGNPTTVSNCSIIANQIGIGTRVNDIISNCIIDSNTVSGILNGYDGYASQFNSVHDCQIKYNNIGIHDSLEVNTPEGKSHFTKNTIEFNTIGILLRTELDTIYCNKICSNTEYDLKYTNSLNTNCVVNNYWCSDFSAAVESQIYDGYDDVNSGLVTFLPLDTVDCYLSTGIEIAQPLHPSFIVFPNPATAQVTITGYTPAYLTLCNTLGQTVAEASNTNTLWLGNLPQGLYLLQMFDAKGALVKTEKVVKE